MSGKKLQVVLATRNKGKIRELAVPLADMGAEVLGLDRFPGIGEIPENGSTFAENALVKAGTVAGQQLIENRGTGGMIGTRRGVEARAQVAGLLAQGIQFRVYRIVQFAGEHLLALAGARHTQFDGRHGGGFSIDFAH